MNLTKNALNLNEERIIEIRNITQNIKNTINEITIFKRNPMNNYEKISKAISLYHSCTHDILNEDEKTIVALYTLITDDKQLKKEILTTKKDYGNIGLKYGVSESFVKLRWFIANKIELFERKTKKLKLKNK